MYRLILCADTAGSRFRLQLEPLDKVLALLESLAMFYIAYPAASATGQILLQTAPRVDDQQMVVLKNGLRDVSCFLSFRVVLLLLQRMRWLIFLASRLKIIRSSCPSRNRTCGNLRRHPLPPTRLRPSHAPFPRTHHRMRRS